ncbi:MAG: hypothetical protein ACRD3Q_18540 [Terriglobales bacterium]
MALDYHIIDLGKTGSGKSSKLRVFGEHLLAAGKPVCIIDPKGDWWGIKSSADGKSAGFPVVIFGGEHADVPINEHSGAQVGELLATGNRPALIDLGGWMVGERTRFFVLFAAAFFKFARGARHLIIDEIHNFAPQGRIMDPDSGKMLHWANRLASEGRGKGITLFVASQRPQKVHKDFVTSCETLIACKVIHKLDRDAIKDWIDGCADPAKGREVLASLAQLKKPEAWVWTPEIDFGPQLVTFPMFRTYDSFKPQSADSAKLKGWAEVDLDEVRTKLQTVVATAEANDPKMLRKRIADLEQQLRAGKSVSPEDLKAHEQRGYERGWMECLAENIKLRNSEHRDVIAAVDEVFKSARPENPDAVAAARRATARPEPLAQARGNGTSPVPARARQIDGRALRSADAGSINKAMPRAMLTTLAQHQEGLTKKQILIHTGYRSSGPVSTCFADILREEWVSAVGSKLQITSKGLEALGPFDPLPTGAELRQQLLTGSKCSTMEKAMLRELFESHPHGLPKGQILERTGYASSGPVSSAFARLVALGYAVQSGRSELRASEDLFS